jgi:hypothetical protein
MHGAASGVYISPGMLLSYVQAALPLDPVGAGQYCPSARSMFSVCC